MMYESIYTPKFSLGRWCFLFIGGLFGPEASVITMAIGLILCLYLGYKLLKKQSLRTDLK